MPRPTAQTYYSRSQMLWFGLLLNFGVGVWMLAANFTRMGRPDLRGHTLLIGLLWLVAGVLVMAGVWIRTGDLSAGQSAWLVVNLVSVLAVLFVHEQQQGAWVAAERERGHRNVSNWTALIHAAVVCVTVLFLISFAMVLLMALGFPVPIPEQLPSAEPAGRDV